ncbi:unnamed protein product [Ceratitis capitata]|uniref:(Mediterranean fruit fly) hypothetical protein n=1 Tax=Ceratitis capitata TaxID=7213 RepID=A0A811V656_CERCA|nr:unnamed protein product [Ceratitis capitata]
MCAVISTVGWVVGWVEAYGAWRCPIEANTYDDGVDICETFIGDILNGLIAPPIDNARTHNTTKTSNLQTQGRVKAKDNNIADDVGDGNGDDDQQLRMAWSGIVLNVVRIFWV